MQLASRLLDFVKKPDVQVEAVDANQELRSVEALVKYGVGPTIRVVFALGESIPKCRMNPFQFHAAILDLVSNARDAMPDGGEIHISTAACDISPDSRTTSGRYVRVRVQDEGLGMSAEVRQKIFEPLFTTKGESGTGLGLPHVKASMHRLGGNVKVSSASGCGTTVDLLFPVAGETSASCEAFAHQATPRSHEPLGIRPMITRSPDSAQPRTHEERPPEP
jgi:signal transduction histidine kinase